MSGMFKRAKSLCKYIALFKNWWWAALARYLKGRLGEVRTLRFRDGRTLIFRPGSNSTAMGGVFVSEDYSPSQGLPDVELVWDIGGNIGSFVIWAAHHYPGAKFESFEPCQENWSILSQNADANPAIRWSVHHFGLANFDGTVEGYVPDEKLGEVSRFGAGGRKVALPLRAINEVWSERGRPGIDILKIDCEGGEYDIFKAMDEQLLLGVRFLIMELHPIPGKDPLLIRNALQKAGLNVQWPGTPQGLVWASRTPVEKLSAGASR
jgi:FkbM family methyltransferase